MRLDAVARISQKDFVTLDETLAKQLETLEEQGLRRSLLALASVGPEQTLNGESVVSFASNDYLGLGERPIRGHEPPGSLASRLVTGNLQIHEELEGALASFVGAEASLLFTSGFAANVGSIPALVGPGDVLFSDRLNHASLIDGARLSGARIVVYPHNDMEALARALKKERGEGRALVVSEAVFSMDGDVADVETLSTLSQKHNAWLYIDEAHSLGVLGKSGAGLCAAKGVTPEVLLGTLGKSFGTQGAFVAGTSTLREWLIHRARSFVFSTGLSPYVSRATLERLSLVQGADKERGQTLGLAEDLRSGLRALGLDVRGEGAAISSVVIGDASKAVKAADGLLRAGFLARAIRPPTVPKGTSRVRFVTSAAHTKEQVDGLVEAMAKVMRRLECA